MAKGQETTTKFRVDISELKSAMQEARRQVALSNSEFKATSSSMNNWSQSTDGISAKLKQLNTNLKSQETVLAQYEKTLEEVKEEYGENSKEATEYATKLNNQKAVVNKTKSEIENFESALKEVAEAEKTASKTGKDVSDVLGDMKTETQNTGGGFTVLKGALAEFVGNGLTALADGLKNAVGNLINLASETREYREDIGKLNTAFTTAGFTTEQASQVYKDFYAVLGEEDRSVEAVSHLAKLVDSEKDLQTWTNICTGVWGTFGDSLPIEGLTEAANETAKTGQLTGSLADALNWAGVSEDEFQGKLDGLSTEQERSAYITKTLNGLYSDTADAYRKNNKNVMAANKAQSDYTDTLATMGAKIEPLTTTVKEGVTELLNEFIKLVEDVDMEEFTGKIEEAFDVLIDDVLPAVKDGLGWIIKNKDTIIAGLAGIAAGFVAFKVVSVIQGVITAMEGMTIAQYALNLAMNLNPIGIVVSLIAGLVAAIVVLWNKSDEFREFFISLWEHLKTSVEETVNKISEFFSGLWTGITNVFSNIGNWFKTKFTEAKDNALNAWSNAKEKWTVTKDKVTGAFNSVGNWFKTKFTEAKNNAVNSWSNAKEKFTNVKDKVTGAFNSVGNWFKTKFTEAKNNALDSWSNAKDKFTSVKDKVTGAFSTVGSWFSTKFTEAKNNAVNAWSNAKDKFTSVKDNITGAFSDLGSKLKTTFSNALNSAKDGFNNVRNIGKDIVTGLWNGINDMTSWVKQKIQGFSSSVLDGIKDFFGIHSPSKLMADEVGKFIPEGMAVGIDKNAKSVLNSMRDLTRSSIGIAKSELGTDVASSTGITGGIVNNFTQNINSPKALSRLEIYRQSKNLLGYAGGAI